MKLKGFIALSFALALFNPCWANSPSRALLAKQQAKLTPQEVLLRLKKGNERFVEARKKYRNHVKDGQLTARKGQHPMAIIFNCVDSRSIANFLFDEGIGNMFVARVAGNVVDKNIIGSMDFATYFANARLIVVMGHTHCGAVAAACQNVQTYSADLTHLIKQIQPAIPTVKKEEGKAFDCDNPKTIDAIARQNVIVQIRRILASSKKIRTLIKEKQLMIVGAMHNIKTGKVLFFDPNGNDIHNQQG